ncbi:MAG: site-2 protease family protein [Acidimicrobiales bacterium]
MGFNEAYLQQRPPKDNHDRNVSLILAAAIILLVVLLRMHKVSETAILFFIVLIPSIIIHEVTHGAVALGFGDDTAKRAGRLTLNPIPHIDIVGTVIVPAVLIMTAGVAFGWAKPVPVSVDKLRNPRNHAVIVSVAGPLVNVILAVACGLLFSLLTPHLDKLYFLDTGRLSVLPVGYQLLFLAGFANVLLAVFNILPIPPLDGSAILERFLPDRWLPSYYRMRPFMLVLPLAVVFLLPGVLASVFDPALSLWQKLLGI